MSAFTPNSVGYKTHHRVPLHPLTGVVPLANYSVHMSPQLLHADGCYHLMAQCPGGMTLNVNAMKIAGG
jgi:hypothetical protein